MQVLIYGAGVYGTLTKKILEQKMVEILAFVDRKFAGKQVEGIPVIAPEEISEYKNYKIYIATKNYYGEIKKYLIEQGCKNIFDIRSILDEDVSQLQLSKQEKDIWVQRKAYKIAVEMDEKEGNKLVHVEAVVTERCTLKCKDCSSLMPYYSNPCNVSIENLISWINNLLRGVSYIGELRILGGEPFLNPELGRIIEEFSNNEKIGMITIYSNGTFIPDEVIFQAIKQNDIFLHISDYGIGTQNRQKFIEKCDKLNISYTVRKYDEWYEFGPFEKNNMPENVLEKMYQNCISANCSTILNGKLYHCPRAAHACSLGLLTDICEENIDLQKKCIDDVDVKRFLYETKYIDACKYCYGTGNSNRMVKAAIQTKK